MTLATPEALAALLRRDKEVLLAAWEQRVQQLDLAADTPTPVLRNDVPRLLEALAEALTQSAAGTASTHVPSTAHGASRERLGAHLTEIVEEYRLLRDTIIDRAQADGMLIAGETSRALNALIDEGIKSAVAAYIEQRDVAEGRRRNDYLRFIVHDLRSPLAAVYYAILLAEKDLGQVPVAERVREIHAAIKRNVERMRGLIVKLLQEEENLKTPARIEPALAPIEVHTVVQAAVHELAPLAAAAETQVVTEVPGGLQVMADGELLARVFQNLLTNAIDRASKGRVTVGARAANGRVECWVGDNGPGAPAGPAPTVREPDPTGGERRSGLGLAIAKRLVEAHAGTIDVESRKIEGTMVRFRLPAA